MTKNYVIQVPVSWETYKRFYEIHMQLRLNSRGRRWTLGDTLELLMNTYTSLQSRAKVY